MQRRIHNNLLGSAPVDSVGFPFVTVLKSTNIVACHSHTDTDTLTIHTDSVRFSSVRFGSVLVDVNKIITAKLCVTVHYIHSLIHIETH